MQIDSYQHGEPSWQDHSSDDAEKASEFYRALFGWEIPPGDPEMGGYRNCSLNGKLVAGIGPKMDPNMPTAWSSYVNVDRAEDVAKLVTDNGGQVIVEPLTIAEVGTMAVFGDPTGAVIGVWQPGIHKGAEVRNEPGAACWHELMTGDTDAAAAFYAAVFGWTAGSHGPTAAGSPGGYTEFKLGDKMVAGMMAKPSGMPAEVPSFWSVYLAVDDADAAAAKITELGGRVLTGPVDTPPGRLAAVQDSTGAVFNILKSSRG
jgi:predicted enzyme related to lactoylglutathione lyase